jgi:hypothetical protein
MQYRRSLVLIGLLLLAACNGNTLPTTVPAPTSELPTATSESETVQQVATPFAEVTLPPVGELVAPVTEDPEAGLVFDLIVFTQSGGPNNTELTIELRSDGTLIRNGEASTVSQADITAIDTMLDEIGYFGIQGIFEAAAPNPDAYSYTITVERAGSSRMITPQDAYTPEELKELFAAILNLGQVIQPRP